MIHRLITGVILSAALFTAQAQNVVSRLSVPDPLNSATVTVTDHSRRLAWDSGGADISGTIRGFRINIFTDNSQRARSEAEATEVRFKELFPDIPVSVSYDAPNFRVIAGYCITNEEAIMLWGRISNVFDRATIINADIPLSDLARPRQENFFE